jgi:hypothetical protein
MQQAHRPDGFFFLFGILRYFPYIAIGLLVIAIAIWVMFGLKKFRWAKILAIVLTVLVVIFGSLSVFSIFMGRNMPRRRMGNWNNTQQSFQQQGNQDFNNGQPQDSTETSSLFYELTINKKSVV